MRMNIQAGRSPRQGRGFSLIEVLIAVVVLATGLLALAALQGALTRNAADARLRSEAVAVAEIVTERLRAEGYNDLRAIIGGGTGAAWLDSQPDIATLRQGSATTYEIAVNGAVIQFPPSDAELTRVVVEVDWTDAMGTARDVSMTSMVSAASLTFDPTAIPPSSTGGPRASPVVRQTSPAGPGVIPIAIGDNQDTAATNPRPQILSTSTPSTRYDVLTYQNLSNNNVRIQQRVETEVAACNCQFRSTDVTGVRGTAQAQWPAYWNGSRYVVYEPEDDTKVPAGRTARAAVNGSGQSAVCDVCCRDHHDPYSASPEAELDVRYSRLPQHKHYRLSGSTLIETTGTGNPNGNYLEACRLIRVDGFWRVSTDLRKEHLGLLATENWPSTPYAITAVPAAAAASAYEKFVIDYLDQRFVQKTNPNAFAMYDEPARALNSPASITIARPTDTGKKEKGQIVYAYDYRRLHGRGLFVDWIEEDAKLQWLKECGLTPNKECLLSFVPFSTVNVTDLAEWKPLVAKLTAIASEDASANKSNQVEVTDREGAYGDDPLNPRGGRTNATITAVSGTTVPVRLLMMKGNSGVAVASPRTPDERTNVARDYQAFVIESGTAPGAGGEFTVELDPGALVLTQLADDSTTNDPLIGWIMAGNSSGCGSTTAPRAEPPDTNPNPYRCITVDPLGTEGVTVAATRYNRPVAKTEGVSCTDPNGATHTFASVERPYCTNYRVASATTSVGGLSPTTTAVTGDGLIDEETQLTFASILQGENVVLLFEWQSEAPADIAQCTANEVTFAPCP